MKIRGNELAFDYAQLLYYFNRGGSYIDSPDWIKNKKVTINPINKKDNKFFQYALTVTLNYEEIKKDPQMITKTKPFINIYYYKYILLRRNRFSIRKR